MALSKVRAIVEDEQQPDLSPAFHWARKASALRKKLNRAVEANSMTLEWLERETGIDEAQIRRSLRDDGGAHPPLALILCIAWHDKTGEFIVGLAEMLRYEAKPKVPDPYDRIRKLETALSAAVAALQEATR
jgi:hypothetical protein